MGLQDGREGRAALREGGHQGGQPWPSDSMAAQPHCPSLTGCRAISAPTTKPRGRIKCGPQSPACHQFCDQVCWQQSWAGLSVLPQGTASWPSAVLQRHGLCLPMCCQHRDSGEGILFPRRTEQCKDNVICGQQHHLCPSDPSMPGLEGPCPDPAHRLGAGTQPAASLLPVYITLIPQTAAPEGCHSCCV